MQEIFTPDGYGEFPLQTHQAMLADEVRVEAFDHALERALRPGELVVDVGTGTGVLAFLAHRRGAGKVVALDRSEVVKLAREVKRRNFPRAPIEFHQIDALRDPLPRVRADLIVCELLGYFGIGEDILQVVSRVRRELLAPGGRIIPHRIQLWVAPIESPALHAELNFWEKPRYGIDFSALQSMAWDNAYQIGGEPFDLLGEPTLLAQRDLMTTRGGGVHDRCELTINRRGTLHGIVAWFRAELDDRIVLTNDPASPTNHWDQIFLPIGPALEVARRDRVDFRFRERTTDEEARWSWSGQLQAARRTARAERASFRRAATMPLW